MKTAEKKTVPVEKQTVGVKPLAKPAMGKPDVGITLAGLTTAYLKKAEAYNRVAKALNARMVAAKKNIDRFQEQLTQTESKLAVLVAPSAQDMIEPLAKEMLKHFPGYSYEVIGPHGLSAALEIVFFEKNATEEERMKGEKSKSITLITKMQGGGLGVRDFTKDSKQYAPGTPGYAAGLNYQSVKVPEDAAVSWLIKWVK
jgi:hypothetical protein